MARITSGLWVDQAGGRAGGACSWAVPGGAAGDGSAGAANDRQSLLNVPPLGLSKNSFALRCSVPQPREKAVQMAGCEALTTLFDTDVGGDDPAAAKAAGAAGIAVSPSHRSPCNKTWSIIRHDGPDRHEFFCFCLLSLVTRF